MTYVVISKSYPIPEVMDEKKWELWGDILRKSKDVVAIHVYGDDGWWDCDVNLKI